MPARVKQHVLVEVLLNSIIQCLQQSQKYSSDDSMAVRDPANMTIHYNMDINPSY